MAGEGKNKAAINEKEDSENWCFVCKDGGELRICDFRQCVKSYHPECVGKKDWFLKSKRDWDCPWHKCLRCPRSSYLRCYTCTKATCRRCLPATRILKVKGEYGFCKHCLKLVLLIEENKECDSDGDYVDFTDPDTAEGLFMEYYTIIKNNEGFKLRDIYAAKGSVSSVKKNDRPKSVPDNFDQESDSSDVRVEKSKHEKRRKSSNGQNPEKRVFVGWASRSLIEFLDSIGKSTTEKLSRDDVTAIVHDYAQRNKLLHPEKRGVIKCDVRLQSVFRKRAVYISRVYDHLKDHFAEDRNGSEEDKVGHVPEASKGQRKADVERKNEEKEAENNQGFELRDIYAAIGSVSVKKNDRPKSCSEDFDCREVRVEKSKHEKDFDCREVRVEKSKHEKRRERSNEQKPEKRNKKVFIEGDNVGPSNEAGTVNAHKRQRKADVEEKNEEKEAENNKGFEGDKVGHVPGPSNVDGAVNTSTRQIKEDVEGINEEKEAENNKGFEGDKVGHVLGPSNVDGAVNTSTRQIKADVEGINEEKEAENNKGFEGDKVGHVLGPSNVDGAVNTSTRQIKADVEGINEEKEAENNKGFEGDKVGHVLGPSNVNGAVNTSTRQIKADVEGINEEKEAVKDAVPIESRFASIVVENMKLLYLRRSVLREMLKEPESFEEKAVGCFVQLRPPTKAYQLIRIKGVKTLSPDETETVLLLSEEPTEMKISLLADTDPDDVSRRGEFDPLMRKFLAGEIERPTVAYIQQKARSLRKDTINFMIRKQLVILRHRVDKANEMGKRHLYSFAEYENDKQRLESPAEYARLLQNVPTVIPDMSEPEADCLSEENAERGLNTSPPEQREPPGPVEVRASESEGRKIEVMDEGENEGNPERDMVCVKGPAGELYKLPLCVLRKWSAEDGGEEVAVPLPEAPVT